MEVPAKENKLGTSKEGCDSHSKNKWWHIDKPMLRFKLQYYLFHGGLGLSLPFLPVFAQDAVGLTASNLSIIITAQQLLIVITKPFIGYLSDIFNRLKATIAILTLASIVSLFLLLPMANLNKIQTPENYENITSELESYVFVNNNKNRICFLKLPDITSFTTPYINNSFCSSEPNNEFEEHTDCKKLSSMVFNKTISKVFLESFPDNSYKKKCSIKFEKSKHDCIIRCDSPKDCYISDCKKEEDVFGLDFNLLQKYQFWLYAVVHITAMTVTNACATIVDTACTETIQNTGADFGRQRLYAALGWGSMAPLGGLLHDYTQEYLIPWILMGTMLALFLWNLWDLNLVQPQFSQNIRKDIVEVMSSKEFLLFQFAVFLNGFGIGIIWFYQIWFLIDIGASRFLCGLVQTVQCFGELPFMFFSGWVIRKIGHFNALSLALMAYSFRFLMYSFLEDPWFTLPIEIMNGFTFGFVYPAIASFSKSHSKPGTEATTMSILFSTKEGLGAGIACILVGIGFDSIGPRQTFFYASLFCGAGMLIIFSSTLWMGTKKKSMSVTSIITK